MKKVFLAALVFASTSFGGPMGMVGSMLDGVSSAPDISPEFMKLFGLAAKEALESTFAEEMCQRGSKEACMKAAIKNLNPKNQDKAMQYLKKAGGCEYGAEDVCAILAYYFDRVYEFDEAIAYAKKGCALPKGQRESCYYLGLFNEAGIVFGGGKQDAKKYYQKACNAQNTNACKKLKSL